MHLAEKNYKLYNPIGREGDEELGKNAFLSMREQTINNPNISMNHETIKINRVWIIEMCNQKTITDTSKQGV